MRIALLATLGLACLVGGGTCLPLVDKTEDAAAPGQTLAIAMLQPRADAALPAGRVLDIAWTASNLTGVPATVTIIAESRTDLSQTVIGSPFQFTGTGETEELSWDTSDASGPYAIIARIEAGAFAHQDTADAIISVVGFEFTAPAGDVSFRPAIDQPLEIAWTGGGTSATVSIGLDTDTDHDNGNEIIIHETELLEQSAAGSFDWTGEDLDGVAVDAGTYNLLATIDDGTNEFDPILFDGLITVAEPLVAFTAPEADTEFRSAVDDPLTISWTGGGTPGTIRIGLDTDASHASGNEVYIFSGNLPDPAGEDSFDWAGDDLDGDPVAPAAYHLFAEVVDSADNTQLIPGVSITIPTFQFTAPEGDATLERGLGESLQIAWFAGGQEATFRIGLERSDGQQDEEEPTEFYIYDGELGLQASEGALNWTGNDVDGEPVPLGQYGLFVEITDADEQTETVNFAGLITIAETPMIISPEDDVSFVADSSLPIWYRVTEGDTVYVDLKLDSDDNHTNGNEITILARQRIDEENTPDHQRFGWYGGDSADPSVRVADGIYYILLVVDTGEGTPQIYEADHEDDEGAQQPTYIFRRTNADQPLVALLTPATAQTVEIGEYVRTSWRAEVPDEGTATITIAIDDDDTPGEGEPGDADDMAEYLVPGEIEASGGLTEDSISWQVPASFGPGAYHVFAYIDADGDGIAEHTSIAPAVLVVQDPTSP